MNIMDRDPVDGTVDIMKARALVFQGLAVNGDHHKQWFLEQIGSALGLDMDWQFEHAFRSPGELTPWPRGIAP
jgi:hypothetical protein